jgi:hypothetical protein
MRRDLLLLRFCLIVSFAVCSLASYQLRQEDPFYKKTNQVILSQLTPLVASSLNANERLATIGPGYIAPWIYNNQYESIAALKRWPGDEDPLPGIAGDVISMYDGFLLTEANPKTPEQVNCVLSARKAYNAWNFENTTAPPWYLDMDDRTWESNFDKGNYRTPFKFQANYSVGGITSVMTYRGQGLLRVNVQPREWYLPSVPYGLRDSRVQGLLCPNKTRVSECFFADNGGIFNAITTGFIVAANIVIVTNVTEPDGSKVGGVTTSKSDIPNILAWVIARMPQWAPLCPCFEDNPARRASQFCTAPWKN